MLAALLAALVGTPIPPDVLRCIEAKRMWVAAPEFFEALTLEGERAYQILDKSQGLTGHLLVMPASCRILVLIEPGHTLSLPEGTRPRAAELASLLKWAGFRELARGPLVSKSFRVEDDVVWFLDAGVLTQVELPSGKIRRLELAPR